MKQTEQMMLGTRKDYMSKIGDVRLQLDEQAEELGFEGLEQAQQAGCEVEWHGTEAVLVEPLELAHRDWEKEKKKVLGYIRDIQDMLEDVYQDENLYKKAVEVAKFIERGEV